MVNPRRVTLWATGLTPSSVRFGCGRRPRYDWENEKWIFPAILDENLNQVPLPRDDLVSQAGYPLSGPPNILRPGQPLPKGYDDLGEGAAAAVARADTGAGSIFPEAEGGTDGKGAA